MFKFFLLMVMFGSAVWATSDTADTSNEIEHKPPANLDPALRRALLKAIENLEGETESTEDVTEDSTTEDSELLRPGDEQDTEKSVSDQVPAVQYHSFVVDGHKAFENDEKIKYSSKKEENNIDPESEEDIEPKETSNALTQTRSIQSNILSESKVRSSGKEVTKRPEAVTKKPVTTTTTTTTPRPTHNEDGENIEELENHEVQVFQAPLVAAFTVHQDAQGAPKKVVPIFKEALRKPITPALPVSRMNLSPVRQNTVITQSVQLPQNQQPFEQQAPLVQQQQVPFVQQQVPFVQQFQPNQYQQQQQLYLQQQLEQKQRLLEEQIQKLQNQARQQEELLRQQQIIQQQFIQQKEQQRYQEEQQRLRQQQYLEQQKQSQQNVIQNNFNRQQQKNNFGSSSVIFQPSISAEAVSTAVRTQQQPPQREAVDFLFHLRSAGQQAQFPLQQQGAPATPNLNLQVPHDKPFQNDFLGKSSQNPGSIRVFRQDSATGNFGLNQNDVFSRNNNNNFNGNFKRFPTRGHDNELKSLLYRSGLTQGGRSQEDLSIISKVLSLNHGIPPRDFFLNTDKNIFFGESRRLENRVRPTSNGNS